MNSTANTPIHFTGTPKSLSEASPGGASPARDEVLRTLFAEVESHTKEGFIAFQCQLGSGRPLVRCLYANQVAEQLLGSTTGLSDVGCRLEEFQCERGGSFKSRIREALRNGESSEGRIRGRVNGRERWFEGVLTPFHEGVTMRFHEVVAEPMQGETLPRDAQGRAMSGGTRDVVWELDLAEQRVVWSESMGRVLGYRPEGPDTPPNTPLKWWSERIHPEDRAGVLKGLFEAVEEGKASWSDEYRFRRADGTYAFIFDRGFVRRDAEGRACSMVGSMVDVTRRVRAEANLLERDIVYKLLSRATNDVLWDWDLVHGDVHWGESMRRAFGYAPETVLPTLQWWVDRIHPEDRDRVAGGLSGAVQGDGEAWKDAYRFRCADGRYAYVLGRGYIARDAAGTPTRMVGTLVDLTERVRSEEALTESEERFRATFNQAAVGLAQVSRAGRCLRVNSRLENILGCPEAQLRHLTLRQLAHPDDVVACEERLGRVLSGEMKSDALECRLKHQSGEYLWVKITLSVAHAAQSGTWAIAVVEDLQARKRLEEEADRAAEFENQLYGMIGHDIRSPLAALKATVAAMESRPVGMSEPQLRALARISRSTNRIQRLVQELLDYTRLRLNDGALPVQPRALNAHALVDQVVEEFERIHPGRVMLCATDMDGRVFWDAERVRQLLENLVENALTHGAHDRPVWLLVSGDEHRLTLKVHNDGDPIPPERLAHLFEPFSPETAEGSTLKQTVKLSLGLGLYLVREVARAHGGTLSVTSSREEGTTFEVRLPRSLAAWTASQDTPPVP